MMKKAILISRNTFETFAPRAAAYADISPSKAVI
jgi:hypothetical protein